MKLNIAVFVLVMSIIYIGIFFIPQSIEKFALNPNKVSAGEIWRFLTYQFAHYNTSHLIENIVALIILGFLLIELGSLLSDFSSIYFSTGFFSVLPLWILLHFTALGASSAIYGGFGMAALESKKFEIKPVYIFVFLLVIIFVKVILTYLNCGARCQDMGPIIKQALSHFSGLVFGALFFVVLQKIKPFLIRKKLYVLRRM